MAAVVGILLGVAPGCSVNRYVVRMQTQLRLMRDDLAIRQQKMNRDFSVMTQLARHSESSLENVARRVESIRPEVAPHTPGRDFAAVVPQLEHLCSSVQELNLTLAGLQARIEAMNEAQYELLRSKNSASGRRQVQEHRPPDRKTEFMNGVLIKQEEIKRYESEQAEVDCPLDGIERCVDPGSVQEESECTIATTSTAASSPDSVPAGRAGVDRARPVQHAHLDDSQRL
jgi:hypothetical protein